MKHGMVLLAQGRIRVFFSTLEVSDFHVTRNGCREQKAITVQTMARGKRKRDTAGLRKIPLFNGEIEGSQTRAILTPISTETPVHEMRNISSPRFRVFPGRRTTSTQTNFLLLPLPKLLWIFTSCPLCYQFDVTTRPNRVSLMGLRSVPPFRAEQKSDQSVSSALPFVPRNISNLFLVGRRAMQ